MSESLGKFLAEERVKKSLSVEDICTATRINSKFIQDVEDDKFASLPGTVFTKGLLRAYAQQLRLDGDEVVARYDSLGVQIEDRSPKLINDMPLRNKPSGKSYTSLFLFIIFLCAVATIFLVREVDFSVVNSVIPALTRDNESVAETVVMETAEQEITAQDEDIPADSPEGISEDVPAVEPVEPEQENEGLLPEKEEPVTATTTVEVVEKVSEAGVSETTNSPLVVAEGDIVIEPDKLHFLSLSATSDSWIKVVVDGVEEKEIILREGKSVRWGADSKFDISIGNVAGVTVAFDGNKIELEQPKSNVIKNMILPKPEASENIETEKTGNELE